MRPNICYMLLLETEIKEIAKRQTLSQCNGSLSSPLWRSATSGPKALQLPFLNINMITLCGDLKRLTGLTS